MLKVILPTFLLIMSLTTSSSHSAGSQFSSIKYYPINSDVECPKNKSISALIDDYAMDGYKGNECVSIDPTLTINGAFVDRIKISKNKFSDPSLNVYDITIVLNKSFSIPTSKSNPKNVEGRFAVFLDNYLLGAYTVGNGVSHKLYFFTINQNIDDLIYNLNRLSNRIKAELDEN